MRVTRHACGMPDGDRVSPDEDRGVMRSQWAIREEEPGATIRSAGSRVGSRGKACGQGTLNVDSERGSRGGCSGERNPGLGCVAEFSEHGIRGEDIGGGPPGRALRNAVCGGIIRGAGSATGKSIAFGGPREKNWDESLGTRSRPVVWVWVGWSPELGHVLRSQGVVPRSLHLGLRSRRFRSAESGFRIPYRSFVSSRRNAMS